MTPTHRISSASGEDDTFEERRHIKRPRLNPSVEVGLMRDGSGRDSASFVGSASGIHFIRSVYGALKERAPSRVLAAETPQSNIVPGEDDKLNGNVDSGPLKSLWQPTEVEETGAFTFDDLLDWTGSYFDVWHPAFPFLHAPSVLEGLETLTHNGPESVSSLELATIKAIVSTSLADRRQTISIYKPVPSTLVFTTFEDALDSVQTIMTRPATLEALQTAVCVQVFLVSMLRLNAASRLGGLIIRMSYQLGLHRCPTQFPAFKTEEQAVRRRLFWSIYSIDRYICQALGLPLTIHDDDVDVCYPDHELHTPQQDNGTKSSPPTSLPTRDLTEIDDRLRLLTLLSKHAEIKGLIMELRNKRLERRAEGLENAISIDAKLTRWWNQVEDSTEQAGLNGIPVSVSHRAVLKVLKHESIISLNRPLLASSKSSPSYAAALQSCISASKSIIKTLHGLAFPIPPFGHITSDSDSDRPLFWPSFTWAIWMSSFIILYAAQEDEVDYQVAVRSTDRALQILTKLAARGNIWPTACGVAIRDLRSTLDESRAKDVDVEGEPVHDSSASGDGFASAADMSFVADGPPNPSQMSIPAAAMQPTSSLPAQIQQDSKTRHLNGAEKASSSAANGATMQTAWYPQNMFGDSWLELGMTLDSELPMFPSTGGLDPLEGFDIPFWMEQEEYAP